ncbi:MAG TPA: sugar ABC transporter permease [Marinobacterium sp.]|nr:sugar ABC transporter permease [Marinobacterium sp.]
MTEQIYSALIAILVGVTAVVVYFWGSNWILDTLISRSSRDNKEVLREKIRPWLFAGPAIFFLTLYLVYPVFETLWLSFHNSDSSAFVGLANYEWLFADREFHQTLQNNLLWLIIVPTLSTVLGLAVAVLADRSKFGTIAKSIVFMPMAISFVGASVIWKFVYHYNGEGDTQIGILNAVIVAFGGEPQFWLSITTWNSVLLMLILVWIQTGFAMVILGAALRGVPEETLEAAIIDGASRRQLFFRITLPQIMPTVIVVWTTIAILVLKVFDIVLAMTNGQWETQVLANLMYDWMFRGAGDFGRGSAIAIIIMISVIPIMAWNIYRFRKDEAGR